MKLSDIISNPNNPRILKDDKFHKLVSSIEQFPKILSSNNRQNAKIRPRY